MTKTAIKKMDGMSICVTLDHWTSKANQTYTGFTCHYTDNEFKLHNFNLGIHLHEGGTKAEELEYSFLELILKKLNLSKCKLFAATTDTTANMNKFGMLLEKSVALVTFTALTMCCSLLPNSAMRKSDGICSQGVPRLRKGRGNSSKHWILKGLQPKV